MFHLRPVTNLDAPELSPYRTMRLQTDHRSEGIFVAEGARVLERLLQSHYGVVSLLLSEDWVERLRPLLEARPEDVPVFVAPRALLGTLTGFHLFQGALAVGRIPARPTLDGLLSGLPKHTPPLLVAAERMASAENMGVLVRNCAAFGVQALLVGETSASPYLRRAVRNSMGAIFKLPIVEPRDLLGALRDLRARGIRCLAAHPRPDACPLPGTNLTRATCIVLGSEGDGLTPEAVEACDEAVAIPMANDVDSLNVSNAAAVFLYEAFRQRALPAAAR